MMGMVRSGFAGRFWEDFKPGETIKHRLGRTLTLFDNVLLTVMGLNTAPLHFDAEYAARTEWGKPITMASIIISIVCGLSSEDITMNIVKEIDFKDVKMLAPVFDGDTLHAQSEIVAVEEAKGRDDAGLVVAKTTGYKEEWNIPVCEFTRSILVYKRDFSPRLRMPGQAFDPANASKRSE